MTLPPRVKRILERSIREARQLGHSYVGTEHILIALLNEQDSYGVLFMEEMGANPSELYNQCVEEISNGRINARGWKPLPTGWCFF